MDVFQDLKRCLAEGDLPHNRDILDQFRRYLELLKQGNRAMNLIGPLSDAEIIADLFCDSLSLAALLNPLPPVVVDIGSGAGFPGIPLKIVQPHIALHLVEPRQKRHHFLGHAGRTLGLTDITRYHDRVEDCAARLPKPAFVCSKAFAPLDQWLPLAASLCGPQGAVGVLCAADHWTPERDAQMQALQLTIQHRRATPRAAGPDRLTLILTPTQ